MLTTAPNLIHSADHVRSWNVPAVRRRHLRRDLLVATLLILITLAVACLILIVPGSLLIGLSAIVLIPALVVWLWRAPERGMYVLFIAAVVQETANPAAIYPDDIGRWLPFFQDFATWTHVKGLSFTMAELFMLLVAVLWLIKGVAYRTLRFDRGSLMLPLGLYSLMILFAELHGLSSGGDFRTSLWEIRSQAYMLIAYVLACNLIDKRRAVDFLLWILIVGAGIKGVQGTWRLYIALHGNVHSVESIFPHEQSFYFNIFLCFVPISFLYGASSRLKKVMLAFLPFVIIAGLANQRRAAILALCLAFVVILMVTAAAQPARRRVLVRIFFALALILPPYYSYYSTKSGLLAEPAAAIASAFNPNPRDASSDLYRVNEDKDILATMKSSPLYGYGFGKPMLTPYPLADISQIYVFWNIMPHNSILWIWMRLGTIGYLFFWLLIGSAVLQATALTIRLRDPVLKGIALLMLTLILQEVVLGYLDLQWSNYRNLISMGIAFALIGKLGRYDVANDPQDMRSAGRPSPYAWARAAVAAMPIEVDHER
jgi:O-antigen ligase/polysaccharide polymerase Wzy-like membrane protein